MSRSQVSSAGTPAVEKVELNKVEPIKLTDAAFRPTGRDPLTFSSPGRFWTASFRDAFGIEQNTGVGVQARIDWLRGEARVFPIVRDPYKQLDARLSGHENWMQRCKGDLEADGRKKGIALKVVIDRTLYIDAQGTRTLADL